MASSNTQRTLDRLRKDGAIVDVVEKWINVPKHPGGGIRRDLFGVFDILALLRGSIVGIQSTGHTNRSEHLAKMLAEPRLADWIRCGGKAELWAWRKRQQGKQVRWEVRIQSILLAAALGPFAPDIG